MNVVRTLMRPPIAYQHPVFPGNLSYHFDASVSRRRLERSALVAIVASLLASVPSHFVASKQSSAQEASPQAEKPMEYLIAPDGTRIAYQRSGIGPPLILVHGTADNHTAWDLLVPALSERFTIYAMDRRGRGESGAADASTYAIEREFEDVAAVVDVAGEPAYLFGHSFGALCALEAALRARNLRRLVLYEPPIPIPPGKAIVPLESVEKLEPLLKAGDFEGVLLTFAREIAQLPDEMIAFMQTLPSWQASVDMAPTIVAEVLAVKSYTFDPEQFRSLATPTLLLQGSESPTYMQVATEAVAAALPHSQTVILEGQGHAAIFTDPEVVLREVIPFLTEK